MHKINNQQHYSFNNFSYAVIIPGLALGMTKQSLISINLLGKQLVDRNFTNRLQVFLHTWDFSWDKPWAEKIKEYSKNLEYIDVHISSTSIEDKQVLNYFGKFFSYTGINSFNKIPEFIFKPLAILYILRQALFLANKTLQSIDNNTQWVILKIKSPTLLPNEKFFENNNFFSMIENQKSKNIRLHTYKEALLMKSSLDCFMGNRISTNFLGEDMFFGGLNSLLRIFRYSPLLMAEDISKYYLSTMITQKTNFTCVEEYEDTLNIPKSNSTEAGFTLGYLVKTSSPKVNFTSCEILNSFTYMRLQSPDICFDSKFVVKSNKIVDRINNASNKYKCEFILSREEYQNLDYNKL